MYMNDRQRLIAQIEEWNSNRLDLFALSQPNEVYRIIIYLQVYTVGELTVIVFLSYITFCRSISNRYL